MLYYIWGVALSPYGGPCCTKDVRNHLLHPYFLPRVHYRFTKHLPHNCLLFHESLPHCQSTIATRLPLFWVYYRYAFATLFINHCHPAILLLPQSCHVFSLSLPRWLFYSCYGYDYSISSGTVFHKTFCRMSAVTVVRVLSCSFNMCIENGVALSEQRKAKDATQRKEHEQLTLFQ